MESPSLQLMTHHHSLSATYPNMAHPLHFLFILILLPSFNTEAFLDEIPSDTSNQLNLHAMIARVCMDVEDQNTCLANIQNEIVKHGPPTPSSVVTAALRATLNEAVGAIDKISKFIRIIGTHIASDAPE